jgi:transcriptional regulator with XRE-family HTH domain
MDDSERLKKLLEGLNMTANKFHNKTGISSTTIYEILNKKVINESTGEMRVLSLDLIDRIKRKIPKVNEDYLKGRSEDMFISGSEYSEEIAENRGIIQYLQEKNEKYIIDNARLQDENKKLKEELNQLKSPLRKT